jgi:hypothetical protein
MPVLGGCQILTLEAPLIAEKAPCMCNGYIYSKDDVRSPFVKPPWEIQCKKSPPFVGILNGHGIRYSMTQNMTWVHILILFSQINHFLITIILNLCVFWTVKLLISEKKMKNEIFFSIHCNNLGVHQATKLPVISLYAIPYLCNNKKKFFVCT